MQTDNVQRISYVISAFIDIQRGKHYTPFAFTFQTRTEISHNYRYCQSSHTILTSPHCPFSRLRNIQLFKDFCHVFRIRSLPPFSLHFFLFLIVFITPTLSTRFSSWVRVLLLVVLVYSEASFEERGGITKQVFNTLGSKTKSIFFLSVTYEETFF